MSYSEYFNETHNQVRASVRKIVQDSVLPYINDWEEAGTFPRELYDEAGRAGVLALGYPEALGGIGEGDVSCTAQDAEPQGETRQAECEVAGKARGQLAEH